MEKSENIKSIIKESKSLQSLELKQYCLEKNLHKVFNKSRSVYTMYNDLGVVPEGMTYEKAKKYIDLYHYFWHFPTLAKTCDNLGKARRQRTKRLNSKIEKMLTTGVCVFMTLTFSDELLDNTSSLTRRRYVTRYLKSQSQHYCANIDFGEDVGREHYHAVVFGRVDMTPWNEKCGFAYVNEVINSGEDVSVKLSKYITKLTNHAIKNTCKNIRLIYSQNWSELVLKSRVKKIAKNDTTVALGLDLFGDDLKVC